MSDEWRLSVKIWTLFGITRKCSLDTTLSPGLNSRTAEPTSTISPATSVTVVSQVQSRECSIWFHVLMSTIMRRLKVHSVNTNYMDNMFIARDIMQCLDTKEWIPGINGNLGRNGRRNPFWTHQSPWLMHDALTLIRTSSFLSKGIGTCTYWRKKKQMLNIITSRNFCRRKLSFSNLT